MKFVPDHLKTREVCERAVEDNLYTLEFVPDHLKTRGMCEGAVDAHPWQLCHVPDKLKHKVCAMRQSEESHTN